MQQPVADLTLCDMYQQGLSIAKLSTAFALPYQYVRKVLAAHHVYVRPKNETARQGNHHSSSKLSPQQREDLIELLKAGEKQHRDLAVMFGITRERVRQIAITVGAPTGKEIRRKLATYKKEHKHETSSIHAIERKAKKEARLQAWAKLWHDGLTLREMADQLGMSHRAIGVRITELRRRHIDLFPYRRHNLALPPPVLP